MLARTITLAVAIAALVSACSKGDPSPPAKARPSTAATAPTPIPARKSGEIDEALKDRLARQEAAAKMFETKVLQPPPPKVPDAPAAVKAATAATAAAPAQVPTAPPPASPQRADPPQPTTAAVANPVQAQPTPAPRTDLAAATPAAPAPAASGAPRLLSRVDPDFPREAVQAGADSGSVKARMTLDAAGGVTRVEIVEANPRRVFDRVVVRALSQWRYNGGPEGRTVDMEVAFRR